MLRLFVLFFLVGMVGSVAAFAQPAPVPVLWQGTAGGNGFDYARAALIATDGSLVLAGETRSSRLEAVDRGGRLDADVLLAKVNSKGKLLWQATYGGTYTEIGHAIVQTPEGGYLIAGETNSKSYTNGLQDFYLVRTNLLGKVLWERAYGGPGKDIAKAAVALPDGGYLVAGESGEPGNDVKSNRGAQDAWVIRVDKEGHLLWEINYGGRGNDNFANAVLADNTSVILVGSTDSQEFDAAGNHGRTDVFVLKINLADGRVIWKRTFGGTQNDEGYGLCKTADGQFLLAGTSFSADGNVAKNYGLGDVWVVKFNKVGEITWERTYGGKHSEGANAVQPTYDGYFLVAGTTSSSDGLVTDYKGRYDGWVLKIDARGDLQWQRTAGGSAKDEFLDIVETPSGDYAAIGYTSSTDGDLVGAYTRGGSDAYAVGLTNPDQDNRIKSLTPTVLAGYVRDKTTGKFVKAEIALVDNKGGKTIYSSKSDTTFGIYQLIAPDVEQLSVGVFAEGYFYTSVDLFVAPGERYGEIRQDWELEPLRVDSVINLQAIQFEAGSSHFLPGSYRHLNNLVDFLRLNPGLRVRISGHTDGVGSPTGKEALSRRRALAVMSYLMQKGIPNNRLETAGYGMSKPLVSPEVTEEDRAKNRRVEVEILR